MTAINTTIARINECLAALPADSAARLKRGLATWTNRADAPIYAWVDHLIEARAKIASLKQSIVTFAHDSCHREMCEERLVLQEQRELQATALLLAVGKIESNDPRRAELEADLAMVGPDALAAYEAFYD